MSARPHPPFPSPIPGDINRTRLLILHETHKGCMTFELQPVVGNAACILGRVPDLRPKHCNGGAHLEAKHAQAVSLALFKYHSSTIQVLFKYYSSTIHSACPHVRGAWECKSLFRKHPRAFLA
jgi:hypothetical protein